jgi:hypothetical protein
MKTSHMLVLALVLPLTMAAAGPSHAACTTSYTVELDTFGEGVQIELRSGVPGHSKIVNAQRSSGGTVQFPGLCAGSYFLAIGNEDDVEVTPVHQFEENHIYRSHITVQTGSGNVEKKSRKSL